VVQLRNICKGLGIQKPCEETLRSIRELIDKEGDHAVTMNELRKALENALKELNERK
jgi:Ca2+-binding EF-hand superfamily protein